MIQLSKCSGSWIVALMQKSKKASFALLLLLFSLSAVQQAAAQCYGVSATGGTNPANAVGAPDGTVASISTGQSITIDFGVVVFANSVINLMSSSTGATASSFSFSLDGITYTTPITLASTPTLTLKQMSLPSNAKYMKISAGVIFGSENIDAVYFNCPCAAPVITASAIQTTCQANGDANSDGTITLATFDANAKKVDFNIGGTYTGAGFASATNITGSSNFVVTSTLANPTINQPYTMRVFCDATTYTDQTVFLAPKQCKSSEMSVSVSPATQTGNLGELLTYTVTLTNAGPNINTNVKVKVPMPPTASATLLSATAASGTYDALTNLWSIASVPVGSTTLTFTLKVN